MDAPDPRIAPDEFAGGLADAAKRLDAAAVLPGSEAALLALANRRSAFPAEVAVGVPPEAIVRRATDKTALEQISLNAGLDVPPTRVIDREATAVGNLDLPATSKPIRSELSEEDQLKRFDARRVETSSELEQALRILPGGVGLVQPCIDGRLISFNGVAFEGKLYGANQHVVHRVWPYRCGQAVYAETIPMTPRRERAVTAFMKELGWNGVSISS